MNADKVLRSRDCWGRLSALGALTAMLIASPPASGAPAQEAHVKASNTDKFDYFGSALAVSGDFMVVGAWSEDSKATGANGDQRDNSATDSGAAYVFARKGATWIQQAYLKASNAEAQDRFGCAVAISGDTIVIGASGEDSSASGVNGNQNDNSATDSGAAYVFVRRGTNWIQQAYLKASNPHGPIALLDERECFGGSVSISGDTVVIGAAGEDSKATGVNGNPADNSAPNSGAAYVFVRDGANWSPQAYLKASNTGQGDNFGTAVSISRDTVVIGAESEASNSTGINGSQANDRAPHAGAAYVFVRNEGNWRQQAYLKASNTGLDDRFGCSVAISENTLVVGARDEKSLSTGVNGNQKDKSGVYPGAAYVFVYTGANWIQQAYLKPSNTPQAHWFGHSVAVSGDALVVGAPMEASGGSGINGNQHNIDAPLSGAAYIFLRTGTNWRQQAYLKASNAGENQFFGRSVSLSKGTAVVGADGESTSGQGANNVQASPHAVSSGAAYIFTGLGIGPPLR